MPEVSRTIERAKSVADGMLRQVCKRGATLGLCWPLCV